MVGSTPVSGVKEGISSRGTAFVSLQMGQFEQARNNKERGKHGKCNHHKHIGLDGGKGDNTEHEGGKGLLGLNHGADGDFLFIFGGPCFDQDGTGNSSGRINIAKNIIDRRYDDR